jgi:hypothetical protein
VAGTGQRSYEQHCSDDADGAENGSGGCETSASLTAF